MNHGEFLFLNNSRYFDFCIAEEYPDKIGSGTEAGKIRSY
jgi:hypothetical protein